MTDQRPDAVISVRVSSEDADELRQCSQRTGRSVSSILREGMRYPLERQRALWLEEHRGDAEAWGDVTAVQAGTPRKLDAVFGVRLTGEQMRDMLPAAEAAGTPLSVFMRTAGLKLAEAVAAGGSVRCPHFSGGPLAAAECQACGPLPVDYAIRLQES